MKNVTQFIGCFTFLANAGVEVHSLDAERTEEQIPLLENSWLKEHSEYVKAKLNYQFPNR